MTANASCRPTTTPSRRLPWWIRRSWRAWARCQRWLFGAPVRRSFAQPGFIDIAALELQVSEEGEHNERPRGCGWFDSSQDLREGLCISEHAAGDAVAAQLPVMAWVQLQLSGWRPDLKLHSA